MLFEFCAEDSVQEWLFYCENDDLILVPRRELSDLACSCCGKLDELESLKRGLSNVRLNTEYDVVLSGEDWLCVSSKFVTLYQDIGANGLEFIAMADGFFAVFCTNLISVDTKVAGFHELQRCVECGRFQERIVGPMAASFGLVEDTGSFFSSDIPNENVRAMHQRIFVSDGILSEFQHRQISGLCFVPW